MNRSKASSPSCSRLGHVASLCFSLGAVACTSLPQTALIYSSRVSGGLDVSVSGTESQGVGITIGFKTTDMAYVPVAVSPLAGAQGQAGPAVMPLTATHGEGLNDAAVKSLPAEQRDRIAAYMTASAETDRARARLRTAQHELKNADERIARNEPAVAGQASPAAMKIKIDTVTADVDAKQKVAEGLLAEAAEAMQAMQVRRTDAMSVFGRFDGSSRADVTQPAGAASGAVGASLTVGRIFSTGVAAQQLTEAAKSEMRSLCLARYLELVKQVDASARLALVQKTTDVCGLASSNGS